MIADQYMRETDIQITQNILLEQWEFRLGKNTRKEMLNNYCLNDILYFSITAKHDPNIVYRFFKISLKDLIKENFISYPFEYNWELNKDEASVYTPKYFSSYLHEVIK